MAGQTRQNDPAIVEHAKALWNRLGALPPGLSPEKRANELCAAAYRDGKLAGVSTVAIGTLSSLPRCRLGIYRCLVAPEYRHGGIARGLTIFSRELLETWSKENPAEKLLGMAVTIPNPHLDELSRIPIWPKSGLALAGYTGDGQQIRIAWFAHARLD